jgi:ParB family chromosome partitioning protein
MSTKSKLLAKTGDLQFPPEDQAVATGLPLANQGSELSTDAEEKRLSAGQFPAFVPGASPRTGPGQMLQFRGQMLAAEGELAKLRERLKEHDGSLPSRKIDPKDIVHSKWANRHPDAFKSAAFESLKLEIAAAGGNVQAIAVHSLGNGKYEVIFGHRRHRACLELGIPVLATIVTSPISEVELFAAMDRENRQRADLSPYEQGVMYRRALDEGLYLSNRRLAEALGVSHTWVANVLMVAELPPVILECFRTPIEIQHRHAKLLAAAMESDRKALLRRAEKLRLAPTKLTPSSVVAALLQAREHGNPEAKQRTLEVAGEKVGTWFKDEAGRLNIQLAAGIVPDDRLEEILRLVAQVLKR